MPDWITRLIEWIFKKPSDDREDLRRDVESLRKINESQAASYGALMDAHLEMANEMRQELVVLRNEVASLRAGLEAEKESHKECRRKLTEHEQDIRNLKAQNAALAMRVESLSRTVEGDDI